MSLLWNGVALGRSRAVRTLLRTRPTIPRLSPCCQSAYYHRFSQSPLSSSTTTSIRKQRPLDETNAEVLSPQQEALQKLGIATDKLLSNRRRINGQQQQHAKQPNKEAPSLHVRVRSVHAAQTFDVIKILSKVFVGDDAPIRHYFGKTSLVVQLKPRNPGDAFRFVAVYRFGSVVFFNMSAREAGKLLEQMKLYGKKSIAAGFERRENFGVVIRPLLALEEEEQVVTGDYCVVESLDMNSVSVVAKIMAQTVALDSYNDIAEELLENFANINSRVRQNGKFTEMEKNSLFRVVAQNNSIFIDMMSKLGIKERSDTAWNMSQYEQVHEDLKEEFEIEHRFDNIEFKLNMIQQNAKFFLEILHNQKTNSLEWIIIVLIAFECVLMVLDMSGTGTPLFDALPQILPDKSILVDTKPPKPPG